MKLMFVLIIFWYSPGGYGADGIGSVRVGTYDLYSQCDIQAKKFHDRAKAYCIPVNGP